MRRRVTISSSGTLLITNYSLQDKVLIGSKMHTIGLFSHTLYTIWIAVLCSKRL